ncbi:MAG TPA: Wzz/FepE/Etk N-terminal domain-containing protein [Steroidobacteraceae bacterium]|nr:Wzz/FepE/Etk N-terminal domain-containing protein [Steroidobacteraceae bacterium]
MNSTQHVSTSQEDEIDLVALWQTAWSHKTLIAITTAICTGIAIVLALTATPIFRAIVVVTPVKDTGMGGEGGLSGDLGGLASLAGIGLGETGAKLENQAILVSRGLVEEFVKSKDVFPIFTAAAQPQPSLWIAVEKFRHAVLDIEEDKLKGTTTITMDWPDPHVAARWANGFVALANNLVRQRAIRDSTREIAYLNEQLQKTNELEVRKGMYNLIEAQTKTLMLANGRDEYAYTVVDPAVVADVRVSPRRTLMALSGVVIGLFIGTFIAWLRDKTARHKRSTQH